MKLSTDTAPQSQTISASQVLEFPTGIVGFPKFSSAEIVYQEDQLPFMWLKGTGEEKISFLIVEPAGLVPEYQLEVSDSDIEALDIKDASEIMVLNIVTIQGEENSKKILLNLIGPVIVNRRTLQARQVIIGNCHKYSARHLLFQEEA